MNKMDIVIMAPIMPVWDNEMFCKPLLSILTNKGFRVSIIDTLSLIHSTDLQETIDAVHHELIARAVSPFLLVGFAMAGTLVQMLSHRMDCLTGVIAISAPGYADYLLNERIGYLMSLLSKGYLDEAIKALHQFVAPEGQTAGQIVLSIPESQRQEATERMLRGFSLLLKLDARPTIAQYHGKYLGIVGEKSQLATWSNQTHSGNPKHRYERIPGAGMRPWNDNASAINLLVNEWVEEL
ncbi:MAG: alpha/beta hydrolase [Serratia symbiotica]|nr:alpha/beta hydrolase [Serratia symbiotica]